MNQGEHILKYLPNAPKVHIPERDHYFYGHGKILLSGEYFVLDGAKALALPTQVGQSLSVKYSSSFSPKLYWKSFDPTGKLWFEAVFEFWRFDLVAPTEATSEVLVLQNILRNVRNQNSHFLRDDLDVHVQTQLGFPLSWGLGSSSTLIHNIATWAHVSPFELLFRTIGGSGYDIACAQSEGPIFYQKTSDGPNWSPVTFDPMFKNNLYFVYLDKKQNSRQAVEYYNSLRPHPPEIIQAISNITDEIHKCHTLEEFNFLVRSHEDLVAKHLNLSSVKKLYFSDFPGEVKSLGAWGGDFILASTKESLSFVRGYFESKGHNTVIPYTELICSDAHVSKIH